MKKELWKHKVAYTMLLTGLTVGLVLFLGVWPNRKWQQILAVGLGIYYAGWGVITHTKTQTITPAVVKEYIGVALLGTVMLLFITL